MQEQYGKMLDDELRLEIFSLMQNRLVEPSVMREEMRAYCPFHDDRHPSMQINFTKGVYFCHACHAKGNFLQLYRELTGVPYKTARIQKERKEPRPMMTDKELILYWATEIWKYPHFINYLRVHRALTEEVIRDYKLGLAKISTGDGTELYFLSIPIWDADGELRNAKLRRLEKVSDDPPAFKFAAVAGKYVWFPRKTVEASSNLAVRPVYYPAWQPTPIDHSQQQVIYFCTGELDALVLRGAGYNAFAGTRGEHFFPNEFLSLAEGKQVYLCPDNDEAGRRWVELAAAKLSTVTELIKVILLPEGVKDITDLVAQNGINAFVDVKREAIDWQPHPDRLDLRLGMFIEGTSYCTIAKKRIRPLSTFIFIPHESIQTNQNLSIFRGELLTPSVRLDNVVIPHTVMRTAREFNDFLQSLTPTATWLGGEHFLRALMPLWASQARVTRKGTGKLGLNRIEEAIETNTWAFVLPNATIPSTVNTMFIDPYNKPLYSIDVNLQDVDLSEMNEYVKAVLQVQPSEVILPLLAYFHAALLAPYVREKINAFPVLCITGIAGAGKTTTVIDVVAPLIGLKAAGSIAARRTTASLRLQASQSASYPLILDEFTPERYGDEVVKTAQELIHYCYNAYETMLAADARQLAGVWSYTAPLVLIGEEFAHIYKAIEDRIIRVEFTTIVDKLPQECVQAYRTVKNLRNIYAPVYAGKLHKFLIENQHQWDNWWDEAVAKAEEYLDASKRILSYRQRLSTFVLAFGLNIMKHFWEHLGLNLPPVDWLHFFTLLFFMNPTLIGNLVEDLLIGIDYLVSIGVIGHDSHFIGGYLPRKYQLRRVIYFNLGYVYNLLVHHYRRNLPSLRAYINALEQEYYSPSKGIVLEKHTRIRAFPTQQLIWAVVIDYDNAKERFTHPLVNLVDFFADKYKQTPIGAEWLKELEDLKQRGEVSYEEEEEQKQFDFDSDVGRTVSTEDFLF